MCIRDSSEQVLVEIEIPNQLAPQLIGFKGAHAQSIRQSANLNKFTVNVSERPVNVELQGLPEEVAKAMKFILAIQKNDFSELGIGSKTVPIKAEGFKWLEENSCKRLKTCSKSFQVHVCLDQKAETVTFNGFENRVKQAAEFIRKFEKGTEIASNSLQSIDGVPIA